MKLIIHADDFGMTRSINEAIIELCNIGTLSSTSVMANMPWSEQVKELLPLKNISLGLHSTFTQGKPLSLPSEIPTIIDEEGNFLNYHSLVKQVKKKQVKVNEIFIELERQYLFLHKLIGDRLVFIDSHHSIHNKLAPFRKAFIQLGKKYKIPAIRTRQLKYLAAEGQKVIVVEPGLKSIGKFGLKKVLVNYYYKNAARLLSKTFKIADGMIVEDKPGAVTILKKVTKVNKKLYADKSFYIVVHPASSLDDIGDSNLQEERIQEYGFLKSAEFTEYIKEHPLSNFGSL